MPLDATALKQYNIKNSKESVIQMKKLTGFLNHVFIDGLSGMALGLFSTLIIGTILGQIASVIPGALGGYINVIAGFCKALTGAGVAVGVAVKYQAKALVAISSAVCGMVGAFAGKITLDSFVPGSITFAGPGEPLGAFIAAFVGIEIGMLVAGRTKIDILVTPLVTVLTGSAAGILLSPPISSFMKWIGSLINFGVEREPILMGIIVSVLMGIALTLPISSAAIGVSLELSGIAAGAACAGCCAQMVGFAVMSFRENKWSGLLSQGVGTSMLQMPNIIRNPLVWIPPIVASAITGPISSFVLGMANNSTGAGMGTAGLVGQLAGYQSMTEAGVSPAVALIEIAVIHFILPALISLGICEALRKIGWIKPGDLKLDV